MAHGWPTHPKIRHKRNTMICEKHIPQFLLSQYKMNKYKCIESTHWIHIFFVKFWIERKQRDDVNWGKSPLHRKWCINIKKEKKRKHHRTHIKPKWSCGIHIAQRKSERERERRRECVCVCVERVQNDRNNSVSHRIASHRNNKKRFNSLI